MDILINLAIAVVGLLALATGVVATGYIIKSLLADSRKGDRYWG